MVNPATDSQGAYVEIDGRKVHLGDDYKVGPVGMSDILQTIKEAAAEVYKNKTQELQLFAMRLKKGDTSALMLAVVTILIAAWISYMILSSMFGDSKAVEKEKEKEEEPEPIVLRDFTLEQLRSFDGNNDQPIYVGLAGEVYDVTQASGYYGPGQTYHLFAGRDSSRAMAKLSFEEDDLANPDVSKLNPFEKDALQDWIHKFKYYKQYPIVGKLSSPDKERVYTIEELAKYNGTGATQDSKVNPCCLVALKGNVYDVSYGGFDMYGPEGPYAKFAGKDISRALAKMSFSAEDLDNADISDLNEKELKILGDWEKKLRDTKKYPIVGTLQN